MKYDGMYLEIPCRCTCRRQWMCLNSEISITRSIFIVQRGTNVLIICGSRTFVTCWSFGFGFGFKDYQRSKIESVSENCYYECHAHDSFRLTSVMKTQLQIMYNDNESYFTTMTSSVTPLCHFEYCPHVMFMRWLLREQVLELTFRNE